MTDRLLKTEDPTVDPPAVPSSLRSISWQFWSAFFVKFCCIGVAVSLLTAWVQGKEIQPLRIAETIVGCLTLFVFVFLRMLAREKAPNDTRHRWYRFSLLELLVVTTGFSLTFGLMLADRRQQISRAVEATQVRDQLQETVSEALGPYGSLSFERNHALSIHVSDRSFNDQRLAKVRDLIQDYLRSGYHVSGIYFVTSTRMVKTPAEWPGITDTSVDVLLGWQELEYISIGMDTGITLEGKKRLLKLPNLNERTKGFLLD